MDLFPVPTMPKHFLEPRRLPGATPESTEALRKVLRENHEKWHAIFHDLGFHNHVAHHVIAIWALGASAESVQEAYDAELHMQRPIAHGVTADMVPITESNFSEHLGEQRYYQNYLAFFDEKVASLGPAEVIAKFILSPAYNTSQSDMLNRYHAGLIHGFIHAGYGLEFGLPGMVSEGLAMTAATPPDPAGDIISSFTTTSQDSSFISQALSSLSLAPPKPATPVQTPHALSFLSRIDAGPTLTMERTPFMGAEFYAKHGWKVKAFARKWIGSAAHGLDGGALQKLLEKKVEELAWMNVVIYAAGGLNAEDNKDFKADFFSMHLVTSSTFLSSHIAHLHPQASLTLLQAYFSSVVFWYIVRRGGTSIDLATFYRNTDTFLQTNPSFNAKISPSTQGQGPASAWTAITESGLTREDEHYPKIQRALLHYSVLYGTKTFADETFPGDSLKVFEKLDGTLFFRAAAATEKRTGPDVVVKGAGYGDTNAFWDGRPGNEEHAGH